MRTVRIPAAATALAVALSGAAAVSPAAAPAARKPAARKPAARKPAKPPRPWATVNVCDTPDAPGAFGVRAFVPRRGDLAQWIRIRVEFLDQASGAWKAVRLGGDGGWQRLGPGRTAVMGGRTFNMSEPAAGSKIVLRGTVDVQWRRRGKPIRRGRVITTAGHANPKDPALTDSRRVCEISR
jgi:hypothetical protein